MHEPTWPSVRGWTPGRRGGKIAPAYCCRVAEFHRRAVSMASTSTVRGVEVSRLPRELRPATRTLLATAGLVFSYVALDWVSFIHGYKGLLITAWSPAIGVLFAFLVQGSAWRGWCCLSRRPVRSC